VQLSFWFIAVAQLVVGGNVFGSRRYSSALDYGQDGTVWQQRRRLDAARHQTTLYITIWQRRGWSRQSVQWPSGRSQRSQKTVARTRRLSASTAHYDSADIAMTLYMCMYVSV